MTEEPDNPEGQRGGIISSAKRLAGTLAATVQNRFELLVVELQEEGIRLIGTLFLVGAIIMFSGLALVLGLFTILLAVGEEHRLTASLLMTLALLAAAVSSTLWLRTRLKSWSAFSGTRAEFRKDREWLLSNRSEP